MDDGTADQTGQITEALRLDILSEAGLWSNDPEQYPGLSERMNPDDGLDLSFRALGYDTSLSTKRMVACSVCPQRQPHHRGSIVRLKTGSIGLVGHDCGDRHFFGDGGWQELQNRMDKESEAALFARRWGPAKLALDGVIARVGEWSTSMEQVKTVQSLLNSRFPIFAKRVSRLIGHGELAAEREITEIYRTATGEERTRTRVVNEVVFRTSVPWFFENRDLATTLSDLAKSVGKSQKLLRADATSQNVVFVKRILRNHLRDLEDIGRMQESLASVASDNSLRQLAQWANQTKVMNGEFSGGSGSLRFKSKSGEMMKVDFDLPVAELNGHWRAVKQGWPSL